MPDIWYHLPVRLRDLLLTLLLLLSVAVVAVILLRGFARGPLVRAMLQRLA